VSHKRVFLITGGTGFVGSLLTRRLVNNKEEVHLIVRKESRFWRIRDILDSVTCHVADLSDTKILKKIVNKIKPTVIYHLATCGAYSYQDEADRIVKTNILGTWNLLMATASVDYELFVNTGSSSEYGFKQFKMREIDLLEPASYYAATKCSQTLLCYHIARDEKKPIVTLRPFSVYGPYEEPTRFIPTLMKTLYFEGRMDLVSPAISRDYIYADDLLGAYLLIDKLKKYRGEIFNIGTGIQSSIKQVIETALGVTGKAANFRWGHMKKRSWDTTNWVADISKARQLLGWMPHINLEDGLFLTWKWFERNHKFYIQKNLR
jgi:nucleoside-diphosphate-sugar epimerase